MTGIKQQKNIVQNEKSNHNRKKSRKYLKRLLRFTKKNTKLTLNLVKSIKRT